MQGTTTRRCAQCGLEKPEKSFAHRRGTWIDKKCYVCRTGRKIREKLIQPGKYLETLEQRLLRWMRFNRQTGCWEWSGSVGSHGYGQVSFQRQRYTAPVAAWLAWRGKIPKGMQVLHKCDVRRCFNPAHLWLGTQLDNMRDMDSKGRRKGHGPSSAYVATRRRLRGKFLPEK
jgi:hypothetical protein